MPNSRKLSRKYWFKRVYEQTRQNTHNIVLHPDKNKVSKKRKKEKKGKHRFKKSPLKVPSSRWARPTQTHQPNQYLCKFKELGKGKYTF